MFALPIFALRLALGMTACLLLLPRGVVNARYYRTHFLIVLALTGVASILISRPANAFLLSFWSFSVVGMGLALVGALLWSLANGPAVRVLILALLIILGGALS
jgi:hypothetical protein